MVYTVLMNIIHNAIERIRFMKRASSLMRDGLYTPRPLQALFSIDKKKYLTANSTTSVFYNRALDQILNTVATSWKPVFRSKANDETQENTAGMEILLAPFHNYTPADFIQQFTKQKRLYKCVLLWIMPYTGDGAGEQGKRYEIQIIDSGSIEQVLFEDGRPTIAKVNIDGRVDELTLNEYSENGFGVIHIDSTVLSGWSSTKFRPVSIHERLDPLFQLENSIRLAMITKSLNANQPSYAFKFDPEAPTEQVEEFRKQLAQSSGSDVGLGVVLQYADVEELSNSEIPESYMTTLQDVQRQIFIEMNLPTNFLDVTAASKVLYQAVLANFYTTAIEPPIQAFTELWNNDVDPLIDINGDTYLSYENTQPTDPQQIAETMVMLKEAGIVNQNEARKELSYESVPGGDDFPQNEADMAPSGQPRMQTTEQYTNDPPRE